MSSRAKRGICLSALLMACSSVGNDAPRTISPTIILTRESTGAPPPAGAFVSVLDSIELRVTTENGAEVARLGQHIGGYRTTAILQPSFPPGNITFTAEVFSNAKVGVFFGTATQLITSDVASLPLAVTAKQPVLLVAPDTARTSTVTTTQLSVYNAGAGVLIWNIAATDTAFTRCGAQCTLSPTSGSLPAGQTATVRLSVPTNFPTRLFSFVFHSTEGNVTAFWQYGVSPVTSVTVQPTASLHKIGQSFPLTASVQASGGTSTAVSWSSSNTAAATVSSAGVVTGVSARATTVIAASVADSAKKASADVRVYDSTTVNAGFVLAQPAGPDTLRRDDTSAGSHSSVVLTARVSAAGAAPFSAVEFWMRPGSSGPWRRVGTSSTSVETTDAGGGHAWAWSYTWNPDATDSPFTNPSTTGVSILAIGITPTGQTTATPPNGNVSVRVP
ncbi:MAG TPA: Ig-like domain-containing protein [Gemmatimonadaceae bacterium]